jgi:arylsulfatase A-like enzyme
MAYSVAVLASAVAAVAASPTQERNNVLFVTVDDLRPEIHAAPFGRDYMHTPNVDALIGSNGTASFSRAHVQQAVCGPSRAR